MEQNHIPSSPLHHRRPSRDSNDEERPEQHGESSRTKLPDPHAHGHPGPSASPQHTTATLSWPSDAPASSPMPPSPDPGWQETTPTWSQEAFAPPTSPSTSSVAAGRPVSPPRPSPLNRPPPLELAPPSSRHSAIPSLLTSQPLDRCASSTSHSPSPRQSRHTPQPQLRPSSPPPPVVTGKRRHRSSSLPPSIPAFKRRRGYSPSQPLPSEKYGRTLVPLKKRASRLELQQARADTWARAYRRRPWSEVQTFVAAKVPPINLASLKTLDAHEILKSPTLRHDLIFDNIAFRPLNSPYPTEMLGSPSHAMLPPTAGKDENGAHAAEMYWEAISHEIVNGCSCLRWKVKVEWPGSGAEPVHHLEERVREEECVCEGSKLGLTDAEWWEHQRVTAWPSRIPEMIQTLKEILLSLMGSTTPCPNHFSYSFSQEALLAHEATCPTVTHALVPQLSAALDPEFLALKIRRGLMSTSIFQLIGEAMKVHCAPLRDSMVDDMIQTALSSSAEDVTMALRKCFACVEIMKLDIANHQVHALRPYLTSHCFGNEISSLKSYLSSKGRTMDTSKMRDWIRSASKEVLQAVAPDGRKHMIGECACRNNSELVLRSLATAFVGTVFTPAWNNASVWPPIGAFERAGIAAAPSGDASTGEEVPESLRMDVRRLKGYHAGAVEITLVHLVLLACRNVWTTLCPQSSVAAMHAAISELAKEVIEVLPGAAIREAIARQPSEEENSELAVYLAHRLIDLSSSSPCESSDIQHTQSERFAIDKVARTLDAFIASHLRPDSALFFDSLSRVKSVLTQQLTNEMLSLQHDPNGSRYKPPPSAKSMCGHSSPLDTFLASRPADAPRAAPLCATAAARRRYSLIQTFFSECEAEQMKKHGLEELQPAIRKLIERMAVLSNFNVGVFGNYYRRKGMIVGA